MAHVSARVRLGPGKVYVRTTAAVFASSVSLGGSITGTTLGNRNLRPENTLETEYGIDAEFFHKYGLNLTYARDITSDELLLVPLPVASGFSNQWQNAGQMDGRTWEVSLNVPLLSTRQLVWTSRLNWDQNRTYITRLDVPEYFNNVTDSNIRFAVGERYGNVYGKQFVTNCSQLPSSEAEQAVTATGPGGECRPLPAARL